MTVDFPTVITTGIVTAAMQALVWLLIRRQIERRDDELDRLREKVEDHHAQRLKKIEEENGQARASRRGLHEDVRLLGENHVLVADCSRYREHNELLRQQILETAKKLERVSERTNQALDRAGALGVEMNSLVRDVAAVIERIKDIRK